MSWLDWAQSAPAPEGHAGYWLSSERIEPQCDRKYGVVIHSAGGNFGPGNMPTDIMAALPKNSWHVSIFKDGTVQKHYPDPSWVAWVSGGPMQNLLLWAVEMDGFHHEPWTSEQTASLKRVLQETWAYGEPRWGTRMAPLPSQTGIQRGVLDWGWNLWDHNWLSPTDCPGSRNDAHRDEVISWLSEEGDMATEADVLTDALAAEMAYIDEVLEAASDLLYQKINLGGSWRKSFDDAPKDKAVFERIHNICKWLRGAVDELDKRTQILGRAD